MTELPEKKPNILIVEDELIVSADIASRLKRMGYQVFAQADTAEKALALCAASKPDLVLMDIRLKGSIDGIAAADTIRTQFQTPVVFLTAHADEPTLQRAKITEPYGYVLKPFEERELRIVIEMSLYRAKAQRQLYQSRSRLAAILNSIGDAVVATDASSRISYLNPVAQRLTGYSQPESENLKFSDVITIVDLASDQPISAEVFSHLSAPNMQLQEVRLRTREGSEYTAIVSVTQITSADGTENGNVFVFRDITQQRRLEEELKQSQRMEAMGQLAVGIAHDLNNILTVVCVNSSLMAESALPNSSELELLTGIFQATDRATKMTNQLLAIGRNQRVQPTVLDFNSIIRDSMTLFQRLLSKNISWHFQPSSQPLPILADKNQIEQILLNLLVNARNAMPNGGSIIFRTSQLDGDVESGEMQRPTALLEVEDTGVGMDTETQLRIWEPFFSHNTAGTGLGLAVVYGVVKQAGGRVSLESNIGKGSIFRVFLPLIETNQLV